MIDEGLYMRVKKIVISACVSMFIAANFQMVYAQSFLKTKYSSDEIVNINVYEKLNPAIVSIDCDLADGVSSGTGCIISDNGVILTSSHVIDGAKEIEVTTANGRVYKAKVLSVMGKENDLALLKIETTEKLPTVALGDSGEVKIGQKVLAIGNPFGFNGTLTSGIVSRIDYTRNKIQTDAAINPGSSGGPIVNVAGEVIGISQSIFNPDNNKSNIGIGFAVPVNEAKKFIKLSKVPISQL